MEIEMELTPANGFLVSARATLIRAVWEYKRLIKGREGAEISPFDLLNLELGLQRVKESLEYGLKGILLQNDVELSELKRMRHSIWKLWKNLEDVAPERKKQLVKDVGVIWEENGGIKAFESTIREYDQVDMNYDLDSGLRKLGREEIEERDMKAFICLIGSANWIFARAYQWREKIVMLVESSGHTTNLEFPGPVTYGREEWDYTEIQKELDGLYDKAMGK